MKVYQIEISNLCNLTCSYCPHPGQVRPKGLMSFETFEKSMRLVRKCAQERVFLHNFGEPLLHPDLPEFVALAGEHGISCSFFTNGVLLTEPLLDRLVQAGLRELCVSAHVAGETARVADLIARTGASVTITAEFRPNRRTNHDWAGQVSAGDAPRCDEIHKVGPCIFERENAFVVLWDGRVNVCCIDSEMSGRELWIDDLLDGPDYCFQQVPLCRSCILMRGDEQL